MRPVRLARCNGHTPRSGSVRWSRAYWPPVPSSGRAGTRRRAACRSCARRIGLLDAACVVAGRDGAEIEKSVEMQVLVAPEGELRPLLGSLLDKVPAGETVDPALRAFADGESDALPAWFTDITLVGTPEQVRSQVQALRRGRGRSLPALVPRCAGPVRDEAVCQRGDAGVPVGAPPFTGGQHPAWNCRDSRRARCR